VINDRNGTPFVGYASLTNGAPGPTSFALFTQMGSAAYTLQAGERCYVTNITVSSSDSGTSQLLTVDSGGTTPTKFASAYVNAGKPLQPISLPPSTCHGIAGVAPRATAAAVTTGTVELTLFGYVSRT
jgi:hypothetical protein